MEITLINADVVIEPEGYEQYGDLAKRTAEDILAGLSSGGSIIQRLTCKLPLHLQDQIRQAVSAAGGSVPAGVNVEVQAIITGFRVL